MNKKNTILIITIGLHIIIALTALFAIVGPEIVFAFADTQQPPNIDYEFYMWVKRIITVSSIFLVIFLFQVKNHYRAIFYFAIAILFNPFVIIHLDIRRIWIIIDTILIIEPIIFLMYWWYKRNSVKIHNPNKLIHHLNKFALKVPLKWTTHDWDFDRIDRIGYADFDEFLKGVQNQFQSMKNDLDKLSPNLAKKIHTFIVDSKPEKEYSWSSDVNINYGWCSLKGLEEHCNNNKKPQLFKLSQPIVFDNNEITTFGDVMNLFKKEIEIRNENDMLESIIDKHTNLGRKFKVEKNKLNGRTFYTDVEAFNSALNKIFSEIKKREQYNEIKVEALQADDSSYIDLRIVQVGSEAHRTAKDLLKEANDGDFQSIKSLLTNLCDWSVESSYEGKHYRVNYLISDRNEQQIEKLDNKPIGFTHILRFYKIA